MPVRLVEIIADEIGFKGTWYRIGQRHFVIQNPAWPKIVTCRWSATDLCGGIDEHDCRVVPGPLASLRCMIKTLQILARSA